MDNPKESSQIHSNKTKSKELRKVVLIWVVEYITVYLLPFLIFAIIFHLTLIDKPCDPNEPSIWDRLKQLPNWMLLGIILFGESLKELIEYLWEEQGTFKENIKFSLSFGLFGISMCAVMLTILILNVYQDGNNIILKPLFYYIQVGTFVVASFYSFLMRILVYKAKKEKQSIIK